MQSRPVVSKSLNVVFVLLMAGINASATMTKAETMDRATAELARAHVTMVFGRGKVPGAS
jgi:hypothetical protein